MAADLSCFVNDLRTLALTKLADAPVRATVIAGRVAWEAT
jgi:hypothetical protein